MSVVERARGAAGCLDFAITADPIDPGFEQAEAMLSVSVAGYDVAEVRPLFGGGTA